MARKSGLSVVANRPEPEPQPVAASGPAPKTAPARQAAATPASVAPKQGGSRYAGQFHVGASYDENDDTVEAFRLLSFKTRRTAKDLLHEAMQLLVDKYDPYSGSKR